MSAVNWPVPRKRPSKLKTSSGLFLTPGEKTGFVLRRPVEVAHGVHVLVPKDESLHFAGLLCRAVDGRKGHGTGQIYKVTCNAVNQGS